MPVDMAREAIIIFVTKLKFVFTMICLGWMFVSLLLCVGFLSMAGEGC